MKKRYTSIYRLFIFPVIFILSVCQVSAQAPALVNYQGVARNAAGVPLPNQNLSLRVNIRSNSTTGPVVFSETRKAQTNSYGLFAVQIGSADAIVSTGSLAKVDWLTGTKFMELEMDPNGGSDFTNLGCTQLLSVPYALNALTAGSAPPSGTAGGDLNGNYPNPVITNNAITYLKLADNAVLTSKLADLSVTDSKIVEISGSKVKGDINGNAANVNGIVSIQNGGTGASDIRQARINLGLDSANNTSDIDKPISKATHDSLLLKLNIADTTLLFQPYTRKTLLADSLMAVRIFVSQKLNIADTAAMLLPYVLASNVSNSLAAKLNVSDSALMLQPYTRQSQLLDSVTSIRNAINQKLNISDIGSMLGAYSLAADLNNGLATKLNVPDSAAMLQPYAKKSLLTDSITAIRNTINQKLNISDFSASLGSYSLASDVANGLATKLNLADTSAMLLGYRRAGVKITDSDLASSYLSITGGVLTGSLSGTSVKLSDTVTASVIIKAGGTSTQYLMADGSVSSGISPVREVADEFTATLSQTSFTLTQTPSVNSKVKMYINGIRISNTAYSVSGAVVTYTSSNNGSYDLTAGDRIQFDYYY